MKTAYSFSILRYIHDVVTGEFILIRNKEFRTILPRDYFTEYVLNKLGLNKRQIQAVKYVKEKGVITNQVFQKISNTIKRTASRDLASLVSLGVFEKSGVTGRQRNTVCFEKFF